LILGINVKRYDSINDAVSRNSTKCYTGLFSPKSDPLPVLILGISLKAFFELKKCSKIYRE